MFQKLLIANRGEIACRIARTARRLGLAVAAVYSADDAGARHVRLADEAWPIGPPPACASYLDAQALLVAARRCGADAIHPGYGFLAESEPFAVACAAVGITFVGPPPGAIAAMGEKAAAKERMRLAAVPVLPGVEGGDQSLSALEQRACELGFPLIVKPAAGGGGKGMQVVREAAQLGAALEASRRVAASAFGDERLLLERYLPRARHVEVQILADAHGCVLHLLDRDCSVQRRHQKLIEEAPAPGLAAPIRSAMAQAACRAAREVGYIGAGTVEFLTDGTDFFFLEMNTRLQVEHTVTEAVTGIDMVEWQLRIAAGEPLGIGQAEVIARGHAVEARVCGEDPAMGFLPAAGRLRLAVWPAEGDGLRVDQGFETGDAVSAHYDSLLGKVIAQAPTRPEAIARLVAALRATRIAGVPTNVEWLAGILASDALRRGEVDTEFLAGLGQPTSCSAEPFSLASPAAAAVVFCLLGTHPARSPWSAMDGFRLGAAEPLEVRLRGEGETWIAEVRVRHDCALDVRLTGTGQTVGYELVERGEAALLELRPALGGASAHALVACDRVDVWRDGRHMQLSIEDPRRSVRREQPRSGGLTAMLPGVVVAVHVSPGDIVSDGEDLLVIEAMKMEHKIRSPRDGIVEAVHVRVGDRVTEGHTLVTMAAPVKEGRP
jgi:3-methylcrotonyl-CoA carboxylase alpha subunit